MNELLLARQITPYNEIQSHVYLVNYKKSIRARPPIQLYCLLSASQVFNLLTYPSWPTTVDYKFRVAWKCNSLMIRYVKPRASLP